MKDVDARDVLALRGAPRAPAWMMSLEVGWHGLSRRASRALLHEMGSHRKKLKRIEGSGTARYLTFSCYRRLQLFNNDATFVEQFIVTRRVPLTSGVRGACQCLCHRRRALQ